MRPVSSTALRADSGSDLNFMRRSLPLNVEIRQRSPFLTTMPWRCPGPIKRPIALKKRQPKSIGVGFASSLWREEGGTGQGPRWFCQGESADGGSEYETRAALAHGDRGDLLSCLHLLRGKR